MDSENIVRARAIQLEVVLERLGAQRDPSDPKRNWRLGAARLTITGSQFYDHNAAGATNRLRSGKPGGGGAIDLLQYLQDLSFKDAVAKLNGYTSTERSVQQRSTIGATKADRPAPVPRQDRMDQVLWYLTERRSIPADTVRRAIAAGQVFGDAIGNVVFRLRDLAGEEIGYEVRGTRDKPFHSVHGRKGLFTLNTSPAPVVTFVESGIEALSYQALHPKGLIVSTTGTAIDLPSRLIQQLSARGYEAVAAFNADTAGDRLSEQLARHSGIPLRRDRPSIHTGKDWNDFLKHRAANTTMTPDNAVPDRSR